VHAFDALALGVVALAALRGLVRGLVREAFSLAALAAACVAVRLFAGPAGEELEQASGLTSPLATAAAGAAIALAAIAAFALAGRIARRLLGAAGLGLADRLGGGALGAAEGALLVAIALGAVAWTLGPDVPWLRGSRSAAAFDEVQRLAERLPEPLPDVAAPPRR
jgi:membrane protein required for colicin V production